MKFYVKEYLEIDVREHQKNSMILQSDEWDDSFSYEILFHAYFFNGKREIELGTIKIADISQTKEKMITMKNIPREFSKLPNSFYSLGQDLNFYRKLKRECNKCNLDAKAILYNLRDIATRNGLRRVIKENENLFYGSMIRSSEAEKALEEARYLLGLDSDSEKSFDIDFKTLINGASKEHHLDMDFDEKARQLPNRINVIIGKNATGKTKVLSALAKEYSGISTKLIKRRKKINRPSFSKYIVISFNAFDEFYNPQIINNEKDKLYYYLDEINEIYDKTEDLAIKKIINEFSIRDGIGRKILFSDKSSINNKLNSLFSYTYCGMRMHGDIVSEKQLKQNFILSYKLIAKKKRRLSWITVIREMFGTESPEVIDEIKKMKSTNIEEKINDFWKLLSSGQHIVIAILTDVIAHIEKESLLLIDEPENHLHPNAISLFMKTINKLLNNYNSYAIIATHSPQIVQQVPAKSIYVFLRNENVPSIERLEIETFGMGISSIIRNVFEVSEKESYYKNILLSMKDKGLNKETIENIFEYGLDFNAKLYLNSIFKGGE